MSVFEIINYAVRSLKINKMRTFLTVLGMIVSISSAVVIHSVGGTLNESLKKSLMGSFGNFLIAEVVSEDGSYTDEIPDSVGITEEMTEQFENIMDGKVKNVKQYTGASGVIYSQGGKYIDLGIVGVNKLAESVYENEMIYGRFITDRDCDEVRNTVVVSDQTALWCFGKEDITGEFIYITDDQGVQHQFTVSGIYRTYSNSGNSQPEVQNAFISYTVYKELFSKNIKNEDLQLFIMNDDCDPDIIKGMSQSIFGKLYNKENWKINVYSENEEIDQVSGLITMLTYIITVIAVVSMITGGIGIMNVMTVSINERTREIGVKKAIGAGNFRIMLEFLTEAVIMSVSGAAAGIYISFNITNIVKIFCNMNNINNIEIVFVIPYMIILASVIISIISGIIFGIAPAMKTLHMDAAEILRAE